MTLEQKIEYYKRYYEYNGLPGGIKASDFFDEEFLDYLLKKQHSFIDIKYNEFEELLKNPMLFNKTAQLLVNYLSPQINSSDFYSLLVNNGDLFNYVSQRIINNDIEGSYFPKLLKDNRTLELLKPIAEKNISFFARMLGFQPINKLKDMLRDPVWKNVYLFVNYDKFFYNLKLFGTDVLDIEYINKKINSLNYNEIIEVLTKYYDSTSGEPVYLRESFKIYENEIRKNKIGQLLVGLNENSNEEIVAKAKELINTNVGMEVLLSSFKIDKFEKISRILGLNPELKDMRKKCFFNILSNYQNYSLDTVKNVFSLYYFEDITVNTIINIGVILKYANSNDEAKKILGTLNEELEKIYNYLNGNQNMNPIELMKDCSINSNTIKEIMDKMYNLFNQDVNKFTDSDVVLKNATIEENNGVIIYHLDNSNDGMFLIHSISVSDEINYKIFCEKSESYNKICMSLLDANHTKTFLGGVIFGYLNIENKLYSATVCDGQTNQRVSAFRQYNSDLITINQFMDNTDQDGYNELAYLTNNKPVMPSYILCIDRNPNDLEIKIAKDFEIPIYVYPTREKIVELPSKQIVHISYDYETSRIQIIPKEFSKYDAMSDENGITFDGSSTHGL